MKTIKPILLVLLTALTLACGYNSPKSTPPAAGTTPTISALNPNDVTAGSAGFTLTIDGANFNSNAQVNWNGNAQTTAFVSGNQLTASVPASLIMSSGSVSITVTNPGNTGTGIYGTGATQAETSKPMTFIVN
jgi:hypothetical protein